MANLAYADIPAWQITELQNLAQAHKLYGVPPQVMSVIVAAESSGSGGAINPQGYGGFFGLGASQKYPGGTTTPQLLRGTDPTSFDAQAEIAASDFAGLLNQFGGDPVRAEFAYQNGPNASYPNGGTQEGSQLMVQYATGHVVPSGPGAPPSGPTSATCNPVISAPSFLGIGGGAILNSCQVQQFTGVLIMLGGSLLALVGVALLAASTGSAGQAVRAFVPSPARRNASALEQQRQENRLELIDARGQQKRYPPLGSLPSDSRPL